jgi:hypothetical protein
MFCFKHLHHRPCPPRRGLPVDLVEAVARRVLAQLLKLPSLAHLPAHARPRRIAPEQHQAGRTVFQIRIHPHLARHRLLVPHAPQPPRRAALQECPPNPVLPAPRRPQLHRHRARTGRDTRLGELLVTRHAVGQIQRHAHGHLVHVRVAHFQSQFEPCPSHRAHHFRQPHLHAFQPPLARQRIHRRRHNQRRQQRRAHRQRHVAHPGQPGRGPRHCGERP